MPTTTAGTSYTKVTHATTSGGAVSLTTPAGYDGNVILFGHGAGGAFDQFMTHPQFAAHRERELNAGTAILELSGGPDLLGSQNWNAAHVDAEVDEAVDFALAALGSIDRVCTWGRSMGNGITSQAHCFNSQLQPLLVGHINHSGVTDWTQAYIDGRFNAYLPDRFNAPTYAAGGLATFTTNVAGRDPIDYGTAWDGRRVLVICGDADVTVPLDKHGRLFFNTYAASLAPGSVLQVIPGGTHNGDASGTYNADSIAPFLEAVFERTPPPAEPALYYSVVSEAVMIDGQLHAVAL